MEGVGLRNSEVRYCRWQDVDLLNGRVLVHRKGGDWQPVPIAPDILGELRRCFRHGFGNRFLRESGKDLSTLQALYGHSRPDTTQGYTDDLSLDEQAEALRKAVENRGAQASPEQTTLGDKPSSSLETEEWRRRESNPRPQPHRHELLQAYLTV
jgi:site-specific recombinase XerC